jgi:hypothetical protein
VITGVWSGKTGFLGNFVKDNFVANLIGYKIVPYEISEKSRFPMENPKKPGPSKNPPKKPKKKTEKNI